MPCALVPCLCLVVMLILTVVHISTDRLHCYILLLWLLSIGLLVFTHSSYHTLCAQVLRYHGTLSDCWIVGR